MGIRRRLLLVVALVLVVLLGTAATALAGTVTVNLKPHVVTKDLFGRAVVSHRNAATIYIYGPKGYYRSKYVPVTTQLLLTEPTITSRFYEAPIGPYRVRVVWAPGYGTTRAIDVSQYPTIGWWAWQQNPTCNFASP